MRGNNRKPEHEGGCKNEGDHRVMVDYDTKEDGSMKKPTVTVLIPAYNEEKTIADTINSIRLQTYLNIVQILVVDDSSTDNTEEIARECGAEVIRTPSNSGTKAQAQNFALPYLKGELTATIDADTILDAEAIDTMVLRFLKEPDIASACSFVVPQRRKNFWELGRTVEYIYGLFMRKKTQEYLGIPIVCSGCFSMFNTALLQKYGFKDRTMAEDMDLTWQLLAEGKKVRFCADTICFPKDPNSWKTYKGQVSRWLRSFFQNLSVHKKDIWKNKKLAVFLYWYLIEGLVGVTFYALLLWNIIFPPTQYIVVTSPVSLIIPVKAIIPLLLLSGVAVVTASVLYQGHKLKISKIEILKGVPCYFALSIVNCCLFIEALLNEWVFKRRLEKWEKGH
ncbi:MAG TPA: glycosyltransferase family 2 protein [Methanophagales archaeon]|nr:glycosyltransferase family 2 protein [Methanophagales archaeon]